MDRNSFDSSSSGNLPPVQVDQKREPEKGKKRRSRTDEEIEQLRTELQQKERDYKTAVEVASMLLEKNNLLTENEENLTRTIKERDDTISSLLHHSRKQELVEKELREELTNATLHFRVLRSGTEEFQSQTAQVYEQLAKLEQETKLQKQQLTSFKEKNKTLWSELETCQLETEKLKATEQLLRKQVKEASSLPDKMVSQDDTLLIEKLEQDVTALKKQNNKLEEQVNELTKQNFKMTEAVDQREQEKEQLSLTIRVLTKTNQSLQERNDELSLLLEAKMNELTSVRYQIEEQIVSNDNVHSASLQNELLLLMEQNELKDRNLWMRNSTERSRSHTIESPRFRSSSAGAVTPKRTSLQNSAQQSPKVDAKPPTPQIVVTEPKPEPTQQKLEDSFDVSDSESEGEQELEVTTLESMNVNELTTELKKLRKERQEMLAIICSELRDRLKGAEIKNLTRIMKSENHFFDLLAVSNSIIDSVSGDLQSKVFDSHPENEAITFTGLIVSFDTQTQEKENAHLSPAFIYSFVLIRKIQDNCKMHRVVNDYVEAVTRSTLDKLEDWRKRFYEEPQVTTKIAEEKKNSAWKKIKQFLLH